MATVDKNFKVKNGLVVEGTSGTINGSEIITEDIITGGTQTNIAVTYDAQTKKVSFVAENGVADSSTDDLVEGLSNLYYTDARVESLIKSAINAGTQTNISVVYDTENNQLNFVAENGVADSTTDDLAEGVVNLYFTDQRAVNALAGLYDPTGSAATAESNANTFTTSAINALTTDEIEEGTTNLYFTNQRAIDAVGGSATSTNTPDTVVKRDGSGDFAAGTITADLSGNVAGTLTGNVNVTNGLDVTVGTISGEADAVSIDASAGNLELSSAADIVLTSATDVRLDPTGNAYVGSASAGNRIATQSDLDNLSSGLAWKQSVNVLANANVALTGSTPLSIDSHTVSDGYRVLLIAQSTATENGIYDMAITGGSYTLTRSADSDSNDELIGASVFVMEGTQYANTSWVQSNHYITAFANQDWNQFSGNGTVTAGNGIVVDGLEISIDSGVVATHSYVSDQIDAITTSVIEEGTNLYFTDQRAIDAVVNGAVDTDDIEEGATNLYFTDLRAQTAVATDIADAVAAGDITATPVYAAIDINNVAKQIATTTTVATAGAAVAHSFSKTAYRSAEYLVKVKYGTHTEISKVLLTLDTSDNIAITEYGIVGTNGTLGTVSAAINSGNVELQVTTANDNSTVLVYGTLLAEPQVIVTAASLIAAAGSLESGASGTWSSTNKFLGIGLGPGSSWGYVSTMQGAPGLSFTTLAQIEAALAADPGGYADSVYDIADAANGHITATYYGNTLHYYNINSSGNVISF